LLIVAGAIYSEYAVEVSESTISASDAGSANKHPKINSTLTVVIADGQV